MKVLVTGAGGFIGSHLTEELVRRGHSVRAMVHYSALGRRGWLEHLPADIAGSVEIIAGDIANLSFMRHAVKGCEGVLHLAALIGIPYSYINPESYIATNVAGTMNVLEASRDLGVQRVVHTSTSEVYGTAQFVPITEDHPVQGQSPYSASKIGADQMAYAYACSFQTPVVTIRPFNTFGPRQSVRAVIPTIITQILAKAGPVKIGSTHPTRDFSYVSDTVRGFIAALESSNKAIIGQTINLGSGFEISIQDTAELIAKSLGTKLEIETDTQRLRPGKSEVERLFCDNSKAKELLGWTPDYAGRSGFERAMTQNIAWYQKPENLALFRAREYNV